MVKAFLNGDKIGLRARYEDRELCKGIEGRQWDSIEKCWNYPLRPESLVAIQRVFPGVIIDPIVVRAISEAQQREAVVTQVKLAGWEKAEAEENMPIKTSPFRHQVAAYNIACKVMGIFKGGGKDVRC